MRTTLTLDPEVAALLNRVRERRKGSLKEIVNEALREGLIRMAKPSRKRVGYRTSPVALGRCLVGNLDDTSEALAIAEGEAFR